MTYTQAQIERAARALAEGYGWDWESIGPNTKADYIRIATDVARELDGGE